MLTTTNPKISVELLDQVKEHFSIIMQWSFIAASLKRCDDCKFTYQTKAITFDREELFVALHIIREADFDHVMKELVGRSFDFSPLRRFELNSVQPHEIELVRSTEVWV